MEDREQEEQMNITIMQKEEFIECQKMINKLTSTNFIQSENMKKKVTSEVDTNKLVVSVSTETLTKPFNEREIQTHSQNWLHRNTIKKT